MQSQTRTFHRTALVKGVNTRSINFSHRPTAFILHIERPVVTRGTTTRHYSSASPTKPFRLAIIGSGPAGFYSAARILKLHDGTKIDMYERLPVPFGLVRYGVAPDHPEVKNCQERFEEVAESPNFEFIGNVDVGGLVPLEVLEQNYDAILFTYGASKDRKLGVLGEDKKGVWSARSFVAWYNGLPGYSHLDFDLENGDVAAIIGQGNVALDVARVLLSPVDALRKTDMPEYALDALSRNRVRLATAVGRRGPLQVLQLNHAGLGLHANILQAAFTIKEIRELISIPHLKFNPVARELFPLNLKSLPRARRRIAELLAKTSELSQQGRASKDFSLEFLQSPSAFASSGADVEKLDSIHFKRQIYRDDSDPFSPEAKVQDSTDEVITLQSNLAFRSIGYVSTPLPGLSDIGVDFDSRNGIIPNESGRVFRTTSQPGMQISLAVPGLYVAGWVKRGPTGVIASTMEDAFATADSIGQDVEQGKDFLHGAVGGGGHGGWRGVEREMQEKGLDIRRTNWKDWKRIDEVERARGAQLGKEREKITGVDEMLEILNW